VINLSTCDLIKNKFLTKVSVLSTLSIAEIDWKPTMNLCMKETKKKQKSKAGKNKGQVRTVTQQEPKQSFFQYFSEPIEVTQRCLHTSIEEYPSTLEKRRRISRLSF
jgi:Nucleosome assembly protein (NAP)